MESIPPSANSPTFPPPASASKALDRDRTRLALKFKRVADTTPTKDIGTPYLR